MRTSILKTLKPKNVYASECNVHWQKVHSLQQWGFITNSIKKTLFFDKLISSYTITRKKAQNTQLLNSILQKNTIQVCNQI
jgi:hypothetical protein